MLSLNRKGIRAKQMVGLIQVKDLSIEILPKMYRKGLPKKTEQIDDAQRNLLFLLHYCYDIPIYENEIAHMQARKSNWFEILTFIFTKNLMEIFKKGAHKQYIPIEENLSVFKGKWMIQKHFRINPFQKHRFYMNYDEFSPDVPINQILRYVTNKLKFQSHDQENRKNLRILDQQMEYITLLHDPIPILNNVVFTRLNENYRPVFNLAKLFIEGNVVETSAGSSGAFAFTFDMNLLFERFIARFIKENRDAILPESLINCDIYMQSNRRAFAKNSDGKNVFYLQPDIIFKEGNSVKLIIDTKYKVLNKNDRKYGVSISDMYQMAAYASRYECSNVILLYPRVADVNGSILEKYVLEKIDCTIKIATVDLRVDLMNSTNKQKLIRDIKEIL
ncbi:MAG: McrC family protein [Bacteroidales bacterium]|nr:McrC family protein [Bacteroidales bacterium]